VALGAIVACSSLGDPGQPVAIEFLVPVPPVVEIGDTITLHARILDQNGDSADGEIRWRTPDTLTVGVDSITGRFWGDSGTSGRVQPTSGSLVIPLVTFAVRARADTVIVSTAAESLFVATADSESALLTPKVAKFDGTGLSDRPLIFTLLEPTDSSVVLSGDVLVDTLTTKADGTPATAIRIKKRGTLPDSALVEVGARRVSGATVPGSGQRIRIFFE
jgi:hypothetical protein